MTEFFPGWLSVSCGSSEAADPLVGRSDEDEDEDEDDRDDDEDEDTEDEDGDEGYSE